MVPGLRRSASTWCEARTELIAPASDRFVADDNPALEQQFFDITQAELKPEIPAYGATDDYRRRAMAVVTQFRILHPTILLDHLLNVTVPVARVPVHTKNDHVMVKVMAVEQPVDFYQLTHCLLTLVKARA